ncbi:hypothetical protein M885DRAFT_507231 [Pelagophyceae sp. CCMP2097]|nr:hypothetical protein M885DRAFT_507231 [Pelagophyceae sp. CCMP2097]
MGPSARAALCDPSGASQALVALKLRRTHRCCPSPRGRRRISLRGWRGKPPCRRMRRGTPQVPTHPGRNPCPTPGG